MRRTASRSAAVQIMHSNRVVRIRGQATGIEGYRWLFGRPLAIDSAGKMTKMAEFSQEMPEERIRPTAPLVSEWDNDDPYLGLPPDLPSGHSRFPIEPCLGYGDLSFDPFLRQNVAEGEQEIVITADERKAWRRAMQHSVGHLIEVPLVDRPAKA